MLGFKSLASGSKGNSSLVITENVKLLIDVGITYLKLKAELNSVDILPEEIDGVLVTHIHSDHIKGLKQFINKTHKKVYVPALMVHEFKDIISEDYIEVIDDVTTFIDLSVELIYTSHDTDCSVGYVISNGNEDLVYITDTGYINKKYNKLLENRCLYFLESNHDEVMLMDGPYPYYLKQRVISDSGHLSNKMTAKYLSTYVGDKTKYVILGHISEKNNTIDLVMETTKKKLDKVNYDGVILIAKQDEALDLIEV